MGLLPVICQYELTIGARTHSHPSRLFESPSVSSLSHAAHSHWLHFVFNTYFIIFIFNRYLHMITVFGLWMNLSETSMQVRVQHPVNY